MGRRGIREGVEGRGLREEDGEERYTERRQGERIERGR